MMYQIMFIGFLTFIIISMSDTTPITDPNVTQVLDSVDKNKANDADGAIHMKNAQKLIVNDEDLEMFSNLACYPPTYNKTVGIELQSYERARKNLLHAYDIMKKEKDTQKACKNRTVEFKNSVKEFIKSQKEYDNHTFILANEVMQAIIYSVCYPEDFYINLASNYNSKVCFNGEAFNLFRLLFSKTVKLQIGQGPIRRAYETMRNENNTEEECNTRIIDFKNAVYEYIKIQKKYNHILTLNDKFMQTLIGVTCDPNYKDLNEEKSEFYNVTHKCRTELFGEDVSLVDNPDKTKNDHDNIDIVNLLFELPMESESNVEYIRKQNYLKCLKGLPISLPFANLAEIIGPPANTTIAPPPVRKGFMGPVWIYLLIAIIILLCGIGAVIAFRRKYQQEGLIEFELKPAQNEEMKNDTKY